MVTWTTRKMVEQTFQNRQGIDATTTKKGPVEEKGPFDQLVSELERNLDTFAMHLTNAQWQHKQFSLVTRNLPQKYVVLCMDFAENYSCYFQDEAQSAHWGKQQITIHPIVAYFHCPEDGEAVKESFVFISKDLNHDSHAVHWFVTKVLADLASRGVEMEKVIHFSDGCLSQYKGRVNFIDCSFSNVDFGIPTAKHFFGSRHGKGPCDAEIGVIKRMTKLDIPRRNVVIRCAEDLFLSVSETLPKPLDSSEHCHQRRSVHFVKQFDRGRDDWTKATKALAGSSSLHCVRGMSEYIVSHKQRSCFCEACITEEGTCPNLEFTGEWRECRLKVRRQGKRQKNPEPTADPDGHDAPEPNADHDGHDAPEPNADPDDHDAPDVLGTSDNLDTPEDRDTPDADAVSITSTGMSVKLGNFVLATEFAESGWGSEQFVGCVKALRPDKGGMEVSFLREKGNSYHFPQIPDEALVLFRDFCILHDANFDAR